MGSPTEEESRAAWHLPLQRGDAGLTSQVTPARQQTTYPVSHFITDSKEHQHIVTFRDPHGVEVTEDVGTCYPALEDRRGVSEDNWGTFRVCLQSTSQDNSGTFQGHGPHFVSFTSSHNHEAIPALFLRHSCDHLFFLVQNT